MSDYHFEDDDSFIEKHGTKIAGALFALLAAGAGVWFVNREPAPKKAAPAKTATVPIPDTAIVTAQDRIATTEMPIRTWRRSWRSWRGSLPGPKRWSCRWSFRRRAYRRVTALSRWKAT